MHSQCKQLKSNVHRGQRVCPHNNGLGNIAAQKNDIAHELMAQSALLGT